MASEADVDDPLVGQELGKYRVEARLGEGGMGAVYRAVDVNLGREVAIKVIRPDLAQNPDFVARFKREAVAAARFQHPNAITLFDYDFGGSSGQPMYLAFEFVKGREFRELIKRMGGIDPRRAVAILAQVLDALEAAHEAGIIHRDLKPQNVMVEQGRRDKVKILDFGIAKLRNSKTAALTMAGQVMGTLAYMSPEQATGSQLDHRADLYSVGVLLFEALTGKIPFNGRNAIEVIQKHRKAPVPTLTAIKPSVPTAFQAIVDKAMAKKPADRYQSARELRDALEAIPLMRLEATSLDHSAQETQDLEAVDREDYASGATDEFFVGLVGKRLAGRYHVLEKLGEGGMAAVFKARHLLYEDAAVFVALKVIHPRMGGDPNARERFLREARAAARFTHPNAIPTRDVGQTEDGLLYMTQDFSEGKDLGRVIDKDGFLDAERGLGLVRQALLALGEAHRRGIVHRDIKPANMLVEADDYLRVCDFGIAKVLDDGGPGGEDGKNLTGEQIIGTPYYISPEQARSRPVDGRTDLYAVGCVLYELLTGKRPFDGDGPLDVVMKHVHEDVVPPSRRAPNVKIDPAVERIVLKAMEKDPSDRFATANDFVLAIDTLGLDLRHATATGRMTLGGAETVPPKTRSGLVVGLGMFALASTAAVAAIMFVPGLKARIWGAGGNPMGANIAGGEDIPLPDVGVTVSPSASASSEPSPSATRKPTPDATPKPTVDSTPEPSPSETAPSASPTQQPTETPAPSPSATERPATTPQPSPGVQPSPSGTPEPSPSATAIPSATPEPSPSATAIPSATPEPTPSATQRPPASPTPAPTPSATVRPSPSATPVPSPTQVADLPRADPIDPQPTRSPPESTPVDPFESGHRPVGSPSATPRPTLTPTQPDSGRTDLPPGGHGDTGRDVTPQRTPRPRGGVGEVIDHTGPAGVKVRLVKVPAQTVRYRGRRADLAAFWMSQDELTVELYAEYVLTTRGRERKERLAPLGPCLKREYESVLGTGRSQGRPGKTPRDFQVHWLREGTLTQAIEGIEHEVALKIATWLGLALPSGPNWLAAWGTYVESGGRTEIPTSGNRVRGLQNSTHEWTERGVMAGADGSTPRFVEPKEGNRTGPGKTSPPVGVRFVRPE